MWTGLRAGLGARLGAGRGAGLGASAHSTYPRPTRVRALRAVFGLALSAACSDPAQFAADDDTAEPGQDISPLFDGVGQDPDAASADGTTRAGGPVWLTFEVDDSENKTFEDGDIKWTGSFSWDAASNTIQPASSWLPTDGPYPVLYDDGPISAGGHEHEGASKGDHIFSTAVKFDAKEATVFEYGALNEFDNWMWVGPNGKLEVPAGASGTLAAAGLKLPKHGGADVKLVLDTSALDPAFAKWAIATHKFYVKGTMNMWTPVQLLDDGTKGDAAANDGILTYVQSENLGKHDGLLRPGDEVQFIYVTTTGDLFPEEGQEYKGATAAKSAGVSGFFASAVGGAWQSTPVVFRKDSKGKFDNTAIVVAGAVEEPCKPACTATQVCEAGQCKDKGPKPCDPVCGDGQTCVDGSCQDMPCDPACGDGQVCQGGVCKDKVCDPPCGANQVCKAGVCADKTCEPACGSGQVCKVDTCVDQLALSAVDPKGGPLAGGTKITLTGKGFAAPAKVMVGASPATDVDVVDGQHITAVTPPGKTGAAAVSVEVAGETKTLDAAFTYDAPPKPTALLLAPLAFAVSEGDAIKGLKAIAKVPTVSQLPGATVGLEVAFGYGPKGTLPNVTPADPKNAWTWKPATFVSEDTAKGEETWGADFGVLPIGDAVFAVRATYAAVTVYGDSNGSEDGVEASKLGTISVTKPDLTPKVTGFDPLWLPAKGGKLTILGKNLDDKLAVTVESSVPAPTVNGTDLAIVAGLGVSATFTPITGVPIPPRPASLIIKPTNAPEVKLENALAVVPFDTPNIDGDVGTDWHVGSLLGMNSNASTWDNNSVGTLSAAYDKDNLYIGVSGSVESQNAIVVYVDIDYGQGTGTQNPTDLKDNTGALDDAIASKYTCSDAKFGADFAVGTLGMVSFSSGVASESASAGWRNLGNTSDFAWLTAPVLAQGGKAMEASIPLATLFPNGIPAKGTRVALFAVITNKTGEAAPDGGVTPGQDGGKAFAVSTVAWFDLFPPN